MKIPEHIEHGIDNLLGLDDPNSTWCHVVEMYANDVFTRLSIGVEGLVANAFITFNQTQYFDGSLWWQGANIRIASLRERDSFVGRINLKVVNPEDYFLFEFTTQNAAIHVVAKGIYYSEVTRHENQVESEDAELIKRIDIRQPDGEPMIVKPYEINGRIRHQSIQVEYILRLLQQGRRYEEILNILSFLEPEDIQACLAYARQQLNKKDT